MRTNKSKIIIVILLLSITIIVSHAIPKARYVGTGFISNLNIPDTVAGWNGKNVTESLNLNFEKDWNKFISEALIYQFKNRAGQEIVFIVLDAGNFHNPKACFTSSGFEYKELEDTELNISGRTITAHTLLTEKNQKSSLSLYWIIVDKQIIHNWIKQKIKQLYYSLFNRQRVGLMIRVDIPIKESEIPYATSVAQQFFTDLSQSLSTEEANYIFGQQ